MKLDLKKLIPQIALPLAVGGLSALLTMDAMKDFAAVSKPPLSPPGWLFPVAWTILYILMGLAQYLYHKALKSSGSGDILYYLQLAFNFFWSLIFFNMKSYTFAFVWLIALFALILGTKVAFEKASKTAGYLLIPYLLWVIFAGYLNLGTAFIN